MRPVSGADTVSAMSLYEATAVHLDNLFPNLDEVELATLTEEVVGRLIEYAEGVLAAAS